MRVQRGGGRHQRAGCLLAPGKLRRNTHGTDGTTRFAAVCPTQATLTDAPRARTPSAPGCRPDAPGPGSKEAESTAASRRTKGRGASHGKKNIFGVRLAEGADLDIPHDGAGRVVQELHAHLRASRRVSPSRAARARDAGVLLAVSPATADGSRAAGLRLLLFVLRGGLSHLRDAAARARAAQDAGHLGQLDRAVLHAVQLPALRKPPTG